MIISHRGIELIKSFENYRPRIYICPAGRRTIGYGHVLKELEDYKYISKSKALYLLKLDVRRIEKIIMRNIFVKLDQNQFDALASFAFNVGGGAFQRSSLRQKINYLSSKDEIFYEFMKWVYVKGKKLNGLIKRRRVEALIFTKDIL